MNGCSETLVTVRICYRGVDCENQRILDMYGAQGRYRSVQEDCEWVEVPSITYPNKTFSFPVPDDGEYEFQWRALRHGVKVAGQQELLCTIPGPWSESSVFSACVAPPVQGEPGQVILTPGSAC